MADKRISELPTTTLQAGDQVAIRRGVGNYAVDITGYYGGTNGATLIGTSSGLSVEAAIALKADNSALAGKANTTSLAATSGASLVGFQQTGTGSVSRTAQDKFREIASVSDFGGSLSTALTNAAAAAPVITGYGGIHLPGWSTIDPGRLLNPTMLPTTAKGRAPLFIINNPASTDLLAGYSAGVQIHIGNNPTATPAAGDTVAQTITVNNINGRTNLWGTNTVVLQDASGSDGICRSAEFEINNVKGFNSDPFSGSAPYRKNGIEIVGHSSSTYKITAAATVWANDTTGTGWFDQGLVISRVASKGIRFVRNPGGASDTGTAFSVSAISDESNSNATLSISGSHGSLIDLSGNPTYSQFILGRNNADTSLNIKNNADYGIGIALDSGTSAAQSSSVDFSDRGTVKWRIIKNNGNSFLIISDPLGSPVNVAEFSPGGGGALGIGRTPSYALDVNGSAGFRSTVGFNGTAPISKPTVTGAKGGNAALASLLTALAAYGLITDSTT